MMAELADWEHLEHYATYMPEQEYLARFYGTFSSWSHISCAYNFEIDKNEQEAKLKRNKCIITMVGIVLVVAIVCGTITGSGGDENMNFYGSTV